MANDKQNTNPNVPNKREQNGIYSGYAEREVLRPQGNVPNKGNVPKLRFPEFSEDWVQVPLSEISERVTRKNKNNISKLPLTISAQYGLVDQITFFNKVVASVDMSNYYLLKKGEFAYNKSYSSDYPWGAIKRLDRYDEGALSTLYICFNIKKCTDSDFAVQYFESPKWHREVSNIAGEGARNHGLLNIAVGDFFNTKHYLPSSIDEQQKIAKLLSLLDQRIATQNKIIEDLKKLKVAIIENIFKDKCCKYKIGDIITQISIRNKSNNVLNVLSVSNKLGFVEQSEQFEDRTVASEDLTNYKIVRTNNFAYNPARINVGSIARLKQYESGIVSPMYICFHTKKNVLPEYLEMFFLTQYFKHEMYKRLEGSVRLCLSFEGLTNIPIFIPEIPLQKEISEKVLAFETKIRIEEHYLNALEKQKQYLLQQMFI